MREFIANMMGRIFSDFYDEVGEMDCLCCLKRFRYGGTHLPEYSDENIQRLYLLRYFPAFLVEYFLIYQQILISKHIKKPFSIISIGSGCGLDYYGAYFAFKSSGLDGEHISYTGLDAIDWDYQKKLGNNKVNFVNKDINEWEALDKGGYNIIIFPKSISEFNIETFSKIKNIFKISTFSENNICLVCSLRDQQKEIDINRFGEIIKILKDEHSFKTEDNPKSIYNYKDSKKYLGYLCGDFNYPDHIKNFITSLSHKCPRFKKNGNKSCKPDCSILDRNPILTDSYINYQFLRLTRN